MSSGEKHKLDDKYFIRHKIYGEKKSTLKRYRELVLGEGGILKLLRYELLITFLGPIPGALGLALRKIFYPGLFKSIGKGVVIGRSVVIRHPDKIRIGNKVIIDDYCVIDARGAGEEGVVIGDEVILNRGAILQAKVGGIHIGGLTNVGGNSVIVAQGGVYIGDMVNIAGGCEISGGAYQVERDMQSDREHGKFTRGPIRIDRKCRLAMRVIVLDAVHIHEGCIVGAGSVVTHDLPEYSVAAGVPAVVKHTRERTTA